MNWDIVKAVAFSLFVVYTAATVLGGFRQGGNGPVWYGDNFIKAVASGVLTLVAYIAVK